MTRDQIIAEARTWVGTPWVHQACCKGAGVDCLHFIAGVVRNVGSEIAERFFANPAWHNYGREPAAADLFAACDELSDRIDPASALPADVLVFRVGRHPMHFGFLTAPDRVMHSWVAAGRVVEHRLDDSWRNRVVRAYRLRELTL